MEFSYLDPIIRLAASTSPPRAGFLKTWSMSSCFLSWSPSSVRLYSWATASSSTPHRLRIRAHMTPVLSLPAVQ